MAILMAFFVWKLKSEGLESLKSDPEVAPKKGSELSDVIKDTGNALTGTAGNVNEKLNPKVQEVNTELGGADDKGKEEEKVQLIKPTLFNWLVACISVLSGLLWTYVLVGFLVDMLNALGIFLNLDNTFLGLTILAVGNALPDALTTISMANGPSVTMAISGGYAGQIFGLLIGFGLAQLKQTLSEGPQPFNLFDPAAISENILDLIVLATAMICLCWTFFWGVYNKFVMNKTFAYVGLTIYGVFFVSCCGIAINKAITTF